MRMCVCVSAFVFASHGKLCAWAFLRAGLLLPVCVSRLQGKSCA